MSGEQPTDPLVDLNSEQAQTLVRSPGSTVAPPHDARLGRKALEVLRTLTHDPRALIDEAPLGHGGMGVIRLARQVALDRRVAVKSLKPGLKASHDVEALLAEAWLAGGLEHPNILPVYSLHLDPEGLPVLVMKRIEGVTWSMLIHDRAALATHAPGVQPLDEHLRILQQVCNAVHFAHARGVIHRDLKPENVMVGAFGEVYVVDWGIATAPGPTTQLAGTPAYMAPEMIGGAGAMLGPRTDVYLLGAMLFEVLTGRAPHHATSPSALFEVVLRSKPELPAGVPEELAALVRKCMSPSPADRPDSALEVRRALEAFLQHQGSNLLAQQSEARAVELTALTSHVGSDRSRIDSLFSECRFGLQQALVSWPGNLRARTALHQVLETMIRFELREGSPRAAQVLLAELPEPGALKADVDAALAREHEKSQQLTRLKELEHTLDPRTGGVSRTIIALVVGLIWVFIPLVDYWLFETPVELEMVRTAPLALLCAVILVVIGIRSQRARSSTPLNRQLLRVVTFAMLMQAVGVTVLYSIGFNGAEYSFVLIASYWFFVSSLVAVSIFPRVWLTALGYLGGAIGSAYFPEHRYAVTTLASVVMCVNVLMIARSQRYQQFHDETSEPHA